MKRKRPTTGDTQVRPDEIAEPEQHCLPISSDYILGPIESTRDQFIKTAPQFEFIVLDPPWPNRSARRKENNYSTAYSLSDIRSLLKLIPISAHLNPEGLVAVWVTNKSKFNDLLTSKDGILEEWGLEVVGEWTWLKITTSGDPVVHLDSTWRKPWERLLIARRRGSSRRLPVERKVLLAVPDVHSRKPSLRPLFEDVFAKDYSGLEVFARNLTAGWWSWGDQALHFQGEEHWVGKEKPPMVSSD